MNNENTNSNEYAVLSPSLNTISNEIRHIHLMGICGTGMASLAGILKEKGYTITGSDNNIYPPMSIFLEELSIPVFKGYTKENLNPTPDLVIVGNVITKYNPEAVELARLNIPYVSMPQALKQYAMEGKKSIVVSGTHGKTTTSSIISWILKNAGKEPGFMIGGIPLNFKSSFSLGNGPFFIVEGDEYDTAFFDKGPKFLHYGPMITLITSIEFDHADIYNDLDHVLESFRKLISIIPPQGLLIANADDPLVLLESQKASCRVITYGLGNKAEWRADDISYEGDFTCLKVIHKEKEYCSIRTPIYGRHNISNLLSAVALSDYLGLDRNDTAKALASFKGIKRRQERRGDKNGILILDDFAHHPTAVSATINAVKNRFPERRLIAVFEPRSNSSRRNIFQEKYSQSFDNADIIMIPEPPLMEGIPTEQRFSSKRLVADLKKKGLTAFYGPDTDQLLDEIINQARTGDIVLIMSNGAFDNIHGRLLERL